METLQNILRPKSWGIVDGYQPHFQNVLALAFFSSLGAACVYVHCVVVWTMHPSNMWNTTYVMSKHVIKVYQISKYITLSQKLGDSVVDIPGCFNQNKSQMAHGFHLPQGSGWTPTKIRQQKKQPQHHTTLIRHRFRFKVSHATHQPTENSESNALGSAWRLSSN